MKLELKPIKYLKPLSWIYGLIVSLRNFLYESGLKSSYKSSTRVVSVGNIVVGGTGKSPFSFFLASKFHAEGKSPVILTRGYKGLIEGPYIVESDDGPIDVGDEALMLARGLKDICPVVVAKDRVAGAKFIEDLQLGDVIILDDGFQHRRLKRDFDIVLLDGPVSDLRKEAVLPAGRLRECPQKALKRASCLIRLYRNLDEDKLNISPAGDDSKLTVLNATLAPSFINDAVSGNRVSVEDLGSKDLVGLTAIAKPDQFFETIEGLGLNLKRRVSYRDHYIFSKSDITSASNDGENPLIVTAKDAVKLDKFVSAPGQLFVLGAEVKFLTEEDEAIFWKLLGA